MKKLYALIIALVFSLNLFAQNTAENWFFGVLAGVKFTPSGVIAINGSMNTNEGCSAISDSSGNLLFYTDGLSVWNKNQALMPNGTGLLGGTSSTQSALIVPAPGSNNIYYVFTVDEIGGPNGFRYSLVDMSLLGNTGDVTVKNSLILNNVTEKLTAVQEGNTGNYWIAVHEWGSDAFYVYHLTASGLQPTPVISNTGIIHSTSQIQNTYGQMKFNTCGNKIALAAGYLNTVELFDFDNNTGVISNPVTLTFGDHVYGLEFSENSQKLYVTTYDVNGTLLQFDVSSGNAAAILSSQTVISQTPLLYALQLASDKKIYVCKSFSPYLGVINAPGLAGIACDFVENGVDLDPTFSGYSSSLGLPAFVQSFFRKETVCTTTGIAEQQPENETVVFPNPFTNSVTISLPAGITDVSVTLFDNTGRKVQAFENINSYRPLSFGALLAAGVYYVKVNSTSYKSTVKVVKLP